MTEEKSHRLAVPAERTREILERLGLLEWERFKNPETQDLMLKVVIEQVSVAILFGDGECQDWTSFAPKHLALRRVQLFVTNTHGRLEYVIAAAGPGALFLGKTKPLAVRHLDPLTTPGAMNAYRNRDGAVVGQWAPLNADACGLRADDEHKLGEFTFASRPAVDSSEFKARREALLTKRRKAEHQPEGEPAAKRQRTTPEKTETVLQRAPSVGTSAIRLRRDVL